MQEWCSKTRKDTKYHTTKQGPNKTRNIFKKDIWLHFKLSCLEFVFIYVWRFVTLINLITHARIQEFSSGGIQVSLTKSSDKVFFFLVLSLFYRSQMVNFKEIYHFSRFQKGGPTFSRGVGPTFSRGGPIAYSL